MNLICGINPVLEALASGARQFDRLVIAKGLRNRRVSDAMARATQLGVPLRFEGRSSLDRMANGLNHQGLIAVVSAKGVIDLGGLLSQARDPALLVVLDGVEDPRNLGAIVRTVEGAGADGLVLPERHTAPLSETVSRASAGALEHVRIARVGNLSQAIEEMKARGLWVVGFDASGTDRWHAVDLKRPVAMVFGGEGRGMRRLVREHCDQIVSLPLFGQVASLNVSVAAGAALYEAVRQRGFVPSHVRPIPARAVTRPKEIVGPDDEDDEDDPGRIGPPVDVRPVDENGYNDVDPAEPQPHTISVIDLHEEVGWSHRGATAVEGSRLIPQRRHEGRRGPRPPGTEAPAPQREGPRAGATEGSSDGRGPKRRRRRGRGRPPGPGERVAGPPAPAVEGPAQSGGEPPPSPAAREGGVDGPRGRRRRRRRRH